MGQYHAKIESYRGPRQRVPAAIAAWTETPAVPAARKLPPGVLGILLEAWLDPEEDAGLLESLRLGARRLRHRFRRRWGRIRMERYAHNFPESGRIPIICLLFLWGMLPYWGRLLRELLLGRRRWMLRSTARRKRRRRLRVHPAVFLGGACLLSAAVVFFATYTRGVTVTYDGEPIGAVSSKAVVSSLRTKLETQTTQALGQRFQLDEGVLACESHWMERKALTGRETLEEALTEKIGLVTEAYCLYVDGEFIGATPYQGALEELQRQLASAGMNQDSISCSFAEKVEVRKEYVPAGSMTNLGYIAETLFSAKSDEVVYEVQPGDTWAGIAERYGLTGESLLKLNPGYSVDRLQPGESLTVSAAVPYLTRTLQQRERYMDEVMYDIQYVDTDTLYQGDYEVVVPGQYGAADVVANVTYINGEETARTVISSVVLQAPVAEVRLQGTTPRPSWLPTGTFRWPVSGPVTSGFGGRKSPGGIGSTNHKGIDISVSYGTPVCAADGGIVTYSGWMGGYGYLVEISHGNDCCTRYAHNSSLLVSVGDKVYKGQELALAGSTGNSVGTHCHFEIRQGSVARNPLNYLP